MTIGFLEEQATYLELPEALWVHQMPVPVKDPSVVCWNEALASEAGIPRLTDAVWGGSKVIGGSTPFSQAYAGHQFGGFTILGDGRAVVLGEHICPDGRRIDVQLKGSGRTPFSRGGDGRAALGPMLREYLISEALHYLGIPTTRSLAVVRTGEAVHREQSQPGALMVRVAESHLRVGTFEFAAQTQDTSTLEALLMYAIERHMPECAAAEIPAAAFLQECCRRQAALIAKWMSVGFVHGVMNTDNMAISGETIDYGPCAFMDEMDVGTVFSSIDRQGRYAYGNQPQIAHWNLAVLASALLPLMGDDTGKAEGIATEALDVFPKEFAQSWRKEMARKLGIVNVREGDDGLIDDFLEILQRHHLDFTSTFLEVEDGCPEHLKKWVADWEARVRSEGGVEAARERMRTANPVVIPRNHVVEPALESASAGDFRTFNEVLAEIKDPMNRERERGDLAKPPPPGTPRVTTYCGT